MKKDSASFVCDVCNHVARLMKLGSKYVKPNFCESCGCKGELMRARIHIHVTLLCGDSLKLTEELAERGCVLIRELVKA